MSWRFRKSFSPLPGVRVTLSRSGLTTSVGSGPFRFTTSSRGQHFTANVPALGLTFQKSIPKAASTPAMRPESSLPAPTELPQPRLQPEPELAEIRSAGSYALTSPGLAELRRLLDVARVENANIKHELRTLREKERSAVEKYLSWKNGWLLRRLFKTRFSNIEAVAEEVTAHLAELKEQERQSRLQTMIELPEGVSAAFHHVTDAFASLTQSQRIWDTVGERSTNRAAERTTASRVVNRKIVRFRLGKCDLIESDWNVPHLENANGGDLFFYPAFVLYFVGDENFALLEYNEVQLQYSATRFIEEDSVPSDSKVVGATWAKANKDGSPDRRFKDNYQIPVAEYGRMIISSSTGLREEYMVSNAARAEVFVKDWKALAQTVAAGI